jgi:hypothetical protein
MSSYLKTLKTKFGDITCDAIHESWGGDEIMNHGDGGKFKFYDSNGGYLDYWEAETICEVAENNGLSPKEWWDQYLRKIESCESFDDLMDHFGDFGWVYGKGDKAKDELVRALTASDAYSAEDVERLKCKSFEEIAGDYYGLINTIGDYTIISRDFGMSFTKGNQGEM